MSQRLACFASALARSPRLWIYFGYAALALATSAALGKDMMWDTLDYHLYAGFSALHDRFAQDYFAAGVQSYFNPYAYVPFYLLATSGLSALAATSILALLQAGVLWLSYELALLGMPAQHPAARHAAACCAGLLAFANPLLINLFGTSSADVVTAEIVLAGWLLLVRAVKAPTTFLVTVAGLLFGVAAALKLTNSVHALSAFAGLIFVPVTLRKRLRLAGYLCVAMAVGFVVVSAPWSLRLEHHFGNPLFPLLNGLFRSPQYPTGRLADYRFVPDSLRAALWRPIAIAAPSKMVDDEYAAPDLRYVLVLALAAATILVWYLRRPISRQSRQSTAESAGSRRILAALGCGLFVDWILWLTASGNGRYFIPMACIAAVLVIALVFRLTADRLAVRTAVLGLIFAAQALAVCLGATYRQHRGWDGNPWFEISMPKRLAAEPTLYFTFGEQSNSFIAPFLAKSSGIINIDGDYVIGPGGANGAHVHSLIREYLPRLRVVLPGENVGDRFTVRSADFAHANDTMQHFGLRIDTRDCSIVQVRDAIATTEGLIACEAVPSAAVDPRLIAGERRADLVFGRVEAACPALFQPAGSVTLDYGDARLGYAWVRRYGNTNLSAVIVGGIVKFVDPVRGGPGVSLGRESDWEKSSVRLVCGRREDRYFAAVVR